MKNLITALAVILSCVFLTSCNRTNTPTTQPTRALNREVQPSREERVVGPINSGDDELSVYISVHPEENLACGRVMGDYVPDQECISISPEQGLTAPYIVGPTLSDNERVRVYTLIAPGLGMVCIITPGNYGASVYCTQRQEQEQEEENPK